MKEHKIVENEFTWVPLNKRLSRFGGSPPPRKAETRTPLFWPARKGEELFFVNSSKDTLNFVIADSGGFQTVDDDVMAVGNNNKYDYKNVKPNQAVKVEEYDGFYELGYILQVSIRVQSKSIGCIELITPAKKVVLGKLFFYGILMKMVKMFQSIIASKP